jgi:hypothetical protein
MKKIVLLLVVVFSFLGCEKDDICDANTPTTPRLVIEFYDNNAPLATTKAVTKLKAVADGMNGVGVVFNTTATDNTKYLSNDKKIYLPLRAGVDEFSTTYSLTLNSGVVGSENTDKVTFTYSHYNVFVSRACGYKTLFDLTNTNTNILTADSDNWIKDISINKANLESENEVHIKIKL